MTSPHRSAHQDNEHERPARTGYGFLGTGEITAAIVEGLHAGAPEPPPIYVSPRSRDVARELADRFRTVRVCGSNQEVLDAAGSIVLAVRPQIADEVLADLMWRVDHVLISAVAGLRLDELRRAAPVERIVRAIPLPQAASRQSHTAMHPDDGAARDLFDRVGQVLVTPDEAALEAVSAATASFAAHLDYLATIVDWLAERGVDRAAARNYVTHIFGRLGTSLLEQPDSLNALRDEHGTPGGINEQVSSDLRRDGFPEMVRRALDRVLTRLRE